MIDMISANFQAAAQLISLGVQAGAILIITAGAVEAMITAGAHYLSGNSTAVDRRKIWLRFASSILLALEFTLAADVIGTAIAPSWEDIGQLAAIAAIRTALSYFLSRDIKEEMGRPVEEAPAGDSQTGAQLT